MRRWSHDDASERPTSRGRTFVRHLPALVLAVACALLVVVDLVEHRLPNALLALAYPALLGTLLLAALLGSDWAALGWAGWQSVLLGVLAAFVLNAVIALVVMVIRRDRHGEVPFGPAMVVGAALALALAGL